VTTVGVDIEQFVVDPYGSGIQRVLQYLAREWPLDLADAIFTFPWDGEYLLLDPQQAAGLIEIAFESRAEDLRVPVHAAITDMGEAVPRLSLKDLAARINAWLLPEVSYQPSVLARFEAMDAVLPTAMIGYDALPMTEPANYRFPPGVAANASEYFRLLASTGALICISEYSRETITHRLRRDPELPTSVANPGGDHVPVAAVRPVRSDTPVHFLRLGTMEERKMPLEILRAFREVRRDGVDARFTYVGGRSSSYEWINAEVEQANREEIGFTWISGASDDDVSEMVDACDALVSFGTEGYGIPVLEAIRRGKPVLFGGVQPAAELMVGIGAFDCGAPSEPSLEQVLARFAEPAEIEEITHQVNPAQVPRWSDFARTTVETVLGSLKSDLLNPVPRGR